MLRLFKKFNEENSEPDILNTTVGLKNMGGNQELYKAVLNEYYNENINTPDILLQAVTEKRYIDASRIVHKIKSSSGSIGANKLYDLSVSLQKALNYNSENDVILLHNEFSDMLKKLLRIIQNL